MIAGFAADYFDGRSARRHAVQVSPGERGLRIDGDGIALEVARDEAWVQPRIGRTPARIWLREGGLVVTRDIAAAEALLEVPPQSTLAHRLESHARVLVVALAVIGAAAVFAYREAIPWLADRVAAGVPAEAEVSMGTEALTLLDRTMLQPTALPTDRQAALQREFADLREAAGSVAQARLAFRSSKVIGANAFALPGGTVVVTDDLAKELADREVAAVLAHELGHVQRRHTLRSLVGASLHAILSFAVVGDAGAISSLAAATPTLLMQSGYSRDFEREADAYAFDLLRRSGRSPRDFAEAMSRLRTKNGGEDSIASYLSTHPSTAERVEAARDAR